MINGIQLIQYAISMMIVKGQAINDINETLHKMVNDASDNFVKQVNDMR